MKKVKNSEFSINNLISRYLNDCFNIRVSDEIIITAPMGDHMDINDLIHDINHSFGCMNTRPICLKWYSSNIREIIGDIFTFLEGCTIKLGNTDWHVINSSGNHISEELMIEYFCPTYSEKFVKKYFKDWKLDKMIEETEKNMGF
jgi:hypothetical protein